jgi:hypothetical protein
VQALTKGAGVTVTSYSIRRIRLWREGPRYAVGALALAGLLASARFAIAPPRPVLPSPPAWSLSAPDLAAEGYAELFAREYLTWDAQDPEAHEQAMARFAGEGASADFGMQLPTSGEERVQWARVVQAREPIRGEHVYTVAAQTDSAGLLYLSVSVRRGADGSLTLAGYPAFVGAPASTPASLSPPEQSSEVSDPALTVVLRRVLRNYLAALTSDLQADLRSGARVSPPASTLTLESVSQLQWAPGGGTVLAVLQAQDTRGAQYTLGYEIDVGRVQGRWEVSAIQMDPDA